MDSDCDNGLYCDGEETCDEATGMCEDGEEVCPNGICDELNDECV